LPVVVGHDAAAGGVLGDPSADEGALRDNSTPAELVADLGVQKDDLLSVEAVAPRVVRDCHVHRRAPFRVRCLATGRSWAGPRSASAILIAGYPRYR